MRSLSKRLFTVIGIVLLAMVLSLVMATLPSNAALMAQEAGVTTTTAPPASKASADNSAEQAKAVLEQDKQKRVQACSKELAQVLRKYNCTLSAFAYIEGNKVTTDVRVIPLDK